MKKKEAIKLLRELHPHELLYIKALMPQVVRLHDMLPKVHACRDCGDCWAYKIKVIDSGNRQQITLCHAISALCSTVETLSANLTGE